MTYFLSSAFSSPYQGFGVLCQFLINPDFLLLDTYSIKKQFPIKKKFFQTMSEAYFPAKLSFFSASDVFPLAASGSDVFPIAIGIVNTIASAGFVGEKGELRNSLRLLTFLLFLFTFRSWPSRSFFFPFL